MMSCVFRNYSTKFTMVFGFIVIYIKDLPFFVIWWIKINESITWQRNDNLLYKLNRIKVIDLYSLLIVGNFLDTTDKLSFIIACIHFPFTSLFYTSNNPCINNSRMVGPV